MEEADKGWMMIRVGEWVNVCSGTGSPGQSWTKDYLGSRAPFQINYISERSMLCDSVYFTTLKSLDYNVVMTFSFNNNNKKGL